MTGPDYLDILTQGVEVWNEWRAKNPEVRPNLAKANLNQADLEGVNLSNTCLEGVELLQARLIGSDFRGADLRNADLTQANFNQSNLSGAYLVGAYLVGACLIDVDLNHANLSEVAAAEANFCGSLLSSAHILKASLQHVDFNQANLVNANLQNSNLTEANLIGSDMREANLSGVDLRGAKVSRADLSMTDLRYSNLQGLDLQDIPLYRANLEGVNLNNALLIRTNLSEANLRYANLSEAQMGGTIFADNDLSFTKGLDTVVHVSPSTIGVDTLNNSGGRVPDAFLKGCGLSDWEIEDAKLRQRHLSYKDINDILYKIYDLRAHQAIQINPLFISYNHADSPFVDKMEQYLNAQGIRFWRDIHHATAGRLERQIDHAIRVNPTVLLILSNQSVKSDWVQHEARLARKLELESGRDILCPIALDDSWKSCKWPERLREQIMEYNILDFSDWYEESSFRQKFRRLISGLDMFYR